MGRNSGQLGFGTKAVYGLGDHTINFSLASMLFVYPFFLTDVVGLEATLASYIPLIGRFADAFSDPLMGRLSDRTTWKAGRRRPFFLIGMVPFGLFFAACWWNVGGLTNAQAFAYYAAAYVLFSLSVTIIAVPYLAITPEMTSGYDERTSLNAFRAIAAILGALLAAAAIRPIAEYLGGGAEGFQAFGLVAGVYVAIFWPFVHRVTFEPEGAAASVQEPFFKSAATLARHPAFRRLTGLYILGRIAIDLTTTMFLFYFTWWLGRPEDFGPTLVVFLIAAAIAMPLWSRVARRTDKHTIFLIGAASWVVSQIGLFLFQPDWPREAIFIGAAIGGLGYAAADMIPWSMLGEVIDEDELLTGERREGLYFGLFMFLRKLGGAVAQSGALQVLGFAGYISVAGGAESQPESAISTIRIMTAGVPAFFVIAAAFVARGFPITRAKHAEILRALDARRSDPA